MSATLCSACGEPRKLYARFLCQPCYQRARKAGTLEASPRQRPFGRDVPFRARLLGRLTINPATGCWEWTGRRTATGYGAGIYRDGRVIMPHRAAWELFNGPAPEGLELDHLCKVRHCCNPAHLEAVTRQVNVRRSSIAAVLRAKAASITHCPAGHEYTPEITYVDPSGYRHCRLCRNERQRTPEARAYQREWKRDRRQARQEAGR